MHIIPERNIIKHISMLGLSLFSEGFHDVKVQSHWHFQTNINQHRCAQRWFPCLFPIHTLRHLRTLPRRPSPLRASCLCSSRTEPNKTPFFLSSLPWLLHPTNVEENNQTNIPITTEVFINAWWFWKMISHSSRQSLDLTFA